MPPAGHLKQVYSLDFADAKSFVDTQCQTPHKGGRVRAVAAFGLAAPPGFQPAPKALPGRGCATPRPPGLAPPGRPSASGPLLLSIKSKGGRKGGGQPQAVHGPQQPPPQARASEARQAEGATPVGKRGGRLGVVGSLLSTSPSRPPACPSGRTGMAVVPRQFRRRRSALSRDHIEKMAGKPLLAWGGRSQL